MRKIILIMIVCAGSIAMIQAQKASKTTILTLQTGEQLIYGENCFNIGSGGKNTLVFTSMSTGGKIQYFLYENGLKKGPFTEIKPDMVKCGGSTYTKNCARQPHSGDFSDQTDKYVTINQADGRATINLNGKTYGPYFSINHLVVSADKKKFYAIIMDPMTMKSDFICSDGRTVPLGGSGDGIYVSPDGNEAYVFQKGTINLEELMKSGGDMSKINIDDMNKVFLVSITGKKLGPFENLNSGETWFCRTNNGLLYRMGYDVYLNGSKLYTLSDTPDPCTFWLSSDSKRYAVVSYDKLLFSNGESYPYPLEVELIIENGKMYLSWVALENGTNLVLFKKEL
jgi:hypothetical protein